jgi:hypothetical protein
LYPRRLGISLEPLNRPESHRQTVLPTPPFLLLRKGGAGGAQPCCSDRRQHHPAPSTPPQPPSWSTVRQSLDSFPYTRQVRRVVDGVAQEMHLFLGWPPRMSQRGPKAVLAQYTTETCTSRHRDASTKVEAMDCSLSPVGDLSVRYAVCLIHLCRRECWELISVSASCPMSLFVRSFCWHQHTVCWRGPYSKMEAHQRTIQDARVRVCISPSAKSLANNKRIDLLISSTNVGSCDPHTNIRDPTRCKVFCNPHT